MTMISKFLFSIEKEKILKPSGIRLHDISIIIPVKNNQKGINNLLKSFFQTHTKENYPKEIIIVDNNSTNKTHIKNEFCKKSIDIKLIECLRKGPACARNLGVQHSTGKWIFFLDSDCILTKNSIQGFVKLNPNAIAYAGLVQSLKNDLLSQYYENQEILVPLKIEDKDGNFIPQYLITANCLVWKKAFVEVGGFNEKISIAGGEDIDLGLKLSKIGYLEYAFSAKVFHDFEDGLTGFVKRFYRYGKGNRVIEEIYNSNLSPKPFKPNIRNATNELLAKIQWLCLKLGYLSMSKTIKNKRITFE